MAFFEDRNKTVNPWADNSPLRKVQKKQPTVFQAANYLADATTSLADNAFGGKGARMFGGMLAKPFTDAREKQNQYLLENRIKAGMPTQEAIAQNKMYGQTGSYGADMSKGSESWGGWNPSKADDQARTINPNYIAKSNNTIGASGTDLTKGNESWGGWNPSKATTQAQTVSMNNPDQQPTNSPQSNQREENGFIPSLQGIRNMMDMPGMGGGPGMHRPPPMAFAEDNDGAGSLKKKIFTKENSPNMNWKERLALNEAIARNEGAALSGKNAVSMANADNETRAQMAADRDGSGGKMPSLNGLKDFMGKKDSKESKSDIPQPEKGKWEPITIGEEKDEFGDVIKQGKQYLRNEYTGEIKEINVPGQVEMLPDDMSKWVNGREYRNKNGDVGRLVDGKFIVPKNSQP